jgi:hypothetical protein
MHTMRKQHDFSKAKRAKDVPHLAKLQTEAKGKTRSTMMLDNDLRQASGSGSVDEDTLRRILREELGAG